MSTIHKHQDTGLAWRPLCRGFKISIVTMTEALKKLSKNWDEVTCKRCLKMKPGYYFDWADDLMIIYPDGSYDMFTYILRRFVRQKARTLDRQKDCKFIRAL